jgi:hypothetical protein
MDEVLAGLPDVKAVLAAGEERQPQQVEQLLIIECIARQRRQVLGIDAYELRSRSAIQLFRDREVDELIEPGPIPALDGRGGHALQLSIGVQIGL